jgi:hypothetical protein
MSDDTERGAPGAPTELLPAYTADASRRRRGGGVVAVAVGVVAALVAATFAVMSLGAGGGSDSPEAAVERLFAAAADEDLIGVMEALTPGERSALLPGVEGIAAELQRIGVLSGDLDLTGVGGLDIEIEGLALEPTELGAGVSAVRIVGGTITTSTDPAAMPLSAALRRLIEEEEEDLEPTSSTEDLAEADAVIVAVDHGDGWHVSPFYSIAEAIRAETDQPVPAFGQGVRPEGAASPEAAVRALVEAGTTVDLRRAIALLDPEEMRVLHDYAPLFLDEIEDELAEVRSSLDITLDRLDLDTETDGDTASVVIRGIAVSGEHDGESVGVDFDGDCFSMTVDGEVEEMCSDEMAELTGDAGGAPAEMGITVVRRDDEWYVSPVRTGIDGVVRLLESIDDSALDDAESMEDLAWSLLSGGALGMMNPMAPIMGTGGFDTGDGTHRPITSSEWKCEDETVDCDPEDMEDLWDDMPEETVRWSQEVEEVCWPIMEELSDDAGDDEWDEAFERYEECMEEIGGP